MTRAEMLDALTNATDDELALAVTALAMARFEADRASAQIVVDATTATLAEQQKLSQTIRGRLLDARVGSKRLSLGVTPTP